MSAFFTATAKVKDGQKLQEYGAQAGATIAAHGGEFILRGKKNEVLAGSADNQMLVVVKFPNSETLSGWYASEEYQALIPLREEAADMTIVSYEIPE